jgi:DNA-binding NtrC family response regulator
MTQTILSVDDEPHMLKLLERIITEKTPFKITTTSNSLEVPELLKQNRYDVILADLKMPGLDGMDILRMVREQERFEEVIIITAFGSLETAIESLSLGVFDYITKPFKKEQIIFTIKRAMRWQEMRQKSSKIDKMFSIEPYSNAQEVFEKEYVRLLSERCEGNKETMADRSGLTPDRIASLESETNTDAN